MYKRILVPLDGSRRAESAVLAAARLARASHGTVILMGVVAPTITENAPTIPTIPTTPGSLFSTSADGEQARDRTTRYLESVADAQALSGIPTRIHVLEGSAAERILNSARSEGADLIVICARGMSGFHRWKLGSVSHHVVRHAECPVLLLPDPAPGAIPEDLVDQLASVRCALAPLDGSPLSEAAIPAALDILAALAPDTGEIQLFRAVSPFTEENRHLADEDLLRQAYAYLTRIADRLRATPTEHLHLTITTAAELDTDSAERIIEIAEPASGGRRDGAPARGCDLIVMATHGRSGILRWALGSVTERVMQATRLPLLVVRPFAADDLYNM